MSSQPTNPGNAYKWKIILYAYNDSYTLQNVATGKYLALINGVVTLSATKTTKCIWRICKTSDFEPLDSFTVADIVMEVGDTVTPTITKVPANATWASAGDFSFTFSNESLFLLTDSGSITANNIQNDVVSVTAIYKLSNDTDTFEDTFEIDIFLPLSGYELDYSTSLWSGNIEDNSNCYAYAINNQVDIDGDIWYKQQPGEYSGNIIETSDCVVPATTIISAVQSDFQYYNEINNTNLVFTSINRFATCPAGTYKIALVINPNKDYHWYRQDSDGYWSHKQGVTSVTRKDSTNNLIKDPQLANRGNYTEFIGYYAVTPWNQYYSSLYSSMDNCSLVTNITVNARGANTISIGMTYSQVSQILDSPGRDIGSGVVLFEYILNNGQTIIINYIRDYNGELIVDNILGLK